MQREDKGSRLQEESERERKRELERERREIKRGRRYIVREEGRRRKRKSMHDRNKSSGQNLELRTLGPLQPSVTLREGHCRVNLTPFF